jgi:hypothetical protein
MLSWKASLWESGVAFCAGSALQDEPAIIAPDREEIAAFQHDPRHLGFHYRLLTDAPPLHETADGVADLVNERTVLPAHRDCATGGFRAIAAFNKT